MSIEIRNAREHNLKNIHVVIDAGLTVITGVSGSGKSSLVFDTLYHESRRRYLDAFGTPSASSRLPPAAVDEISGLGPAIMIGQNLLNRNPNSTVATATGLHPLYRLLFARFGTRRCPVCGEELVVYTRDEAIRRLVSMCTTDVVSIVVPLVRAAPGSHTLLLGFLADRFGSENVIFDGTALPGSARPVPGQRGNRSSDRAASTRVANARTDREGRNRRGKVGDHSIDLVVGRLAPGASFPEARELFEKAASFGVTWVRAVLEDGSEVPLAFAPVCTRCDRWMADLEPKCFNAPMSEEAQAVLVDGLRFEELLGSTIAEETERVRGSRLHEFAPRLYDEIYKRLSSLCEIGLGYIQLDRPSPTLSRGEAQRLRLSIALTSRLEDMMHVLDEPTVGQHPADIDKLISAFRNLPGPVVFVEHDRTAAAPADRAIDLGPGAGMKGGSVTFSGTTRNLWNSDTTTGRYFSLRESVCVPLRREIGDRWISIRGAGFRNLRGFDIEIPVGCFTVVTGVSGSGKSTLVMDVIAPTIEKSKPIGCKGFAIPKDDKLKVISVDQSPIGVNPRSNPATYTKLLDSIRKLFSTITGESPSLFTFNTKEGACPTCGGLGGIEVTMRYLPSSWIVCSDCEGRRYRDEVLSHTLPLGGRDFSIADLLDTPISEVHRLIQAAEHASGAGNAAEAESGNANKAAGPDVSPKPADAAPAAATHPTVTFSPAGLELLRSITRALGILEEIGLGYLTLGQPSPTLSGGEAQRIKLAKFLSRRSLSGNLIILDEPSTGLHPADIAGLLAIIDRLARSGATIVVVEHNTDIIRAADRIIDLGPGSGPEGGSLLYAGPAEGICAHTDSPTADALRGEADIAPAAGHRRPKEHPGSIRISGAGMHNLKNIDVEIPKARLTVVTGVSGSGKSTLVSDILEAEAKRRHLESLSMYERQSTRESIEPDVDQIRGLGITASLSSSTHAFDLRRDTGALTGLGYDIAVLTATAGIRACPSCSSPMKRTGAGYRCDCGHSRPPDEPRHFLPSTYASACRACHGVGTQQVPVPERLIVAPEKPICAGAMHSPGFFPKGYLCKPGNGGYYLLQAFARRYGFDPETTPWNQLSHDVQRKFLFGDPEPVEVHYIGKTGIQKTYASRYPGFYGWIRDWDLGGTYTETKPCPECKGARLRREYLSVELLGHTVHDLRSLPFNSILSVIESIDRSSIPKEAVTANERARAKLSFLRSVGLGYLNMNQPAAAMSAGEAQRMRLAQLLGSRLSSMTVLIDEPTRGMHPSEVAELIEALHELRDSGNTIVVVEHDPEVISAADHLIELGPGPGAFGGNVVARGSVESIRTSDTATGAWLRRIGDAVTAAAPDSGSVPTSAAAAGPAGKAASGAAAGPGAIPWITVLGAEENNLKNIDVRIPVGLLTGVCGVSGSGKSTLIVDTLGRALSPKKQTTSVAYEPIDPGRYRSIENAPDSCIIVDQTRAGIVNPADYMGVEQRLRKLYAQSIDAVESGLSEKSFRRSCTACNGRGFTSIDMGFLPSVASPCEVCSGTGYAGDVTDVRLRGLTIAELLSTEIDRVLEIWGDEESVAAPLESSRTVGLGYLELRRAGHTLSGGEAQRLKIARELSKKRRAPTLYVLDEPTLGQHLEDTDRLYRVIRSLCRNGNTVIVIEHHPLTLARCDWLIELGPGGGPQGGRVVFEGAPRELAGSDTVSARYVSEALSIIDSIERDGDRADG